MKEDFLQVIWQNQYLDRSQEWTSDHGSLKIIKPGYRNRGAGPDFDQAKLLIGDLEWIGSVEIHVKASEWNLHGHQKDPAYQSVILHVVWENDTAVTRSDGSPVPTFEIKNLVPLEVLLKYRSLMDSQKKEKPCSPFLPNVEPMVIISMQERALVERLERKSSSILDRLANNQMNWMDTFYQTIAWNLGLKTNSESILTLAQRTPSKILASLAWKPEQILPLFLGMAGFLDQPDSTVNLDKPKAEFQFLSTKCSLKIPHIQWNNFGVRRAAKPLARVVLLAGIAAHLPVWFQQLTETNAPTEFFKEMNFMAFPVWLKPLLQLHKIPQYNITLSPFLQTSLIINSFAPTLMAMSIQTGEKDLIDKALGWLSALPSEKNTLVEQWKQWNITSKDASQSQSLIELHNEYCIKMRCMDCGIGQEILRK